MSGERIGPITFPSKRMSSLASRLSLNVALFILMANHFCSRVTLQLLCVKNIPCRVASFIDIQLKQKDWGQSRE